MPKSRKSRIAKHRERLSLGTDMASQLQLSLSVPDTQEDTCQVPVGDYTIFDALRDREIPTGAAAVYLVLNEASNWSTGWTHHLSYSEIERRMGLSMPRSTIISHVQSLQSEGWIAETNHHSDKNKGNTYRLVHHNCDPLDAPRDKDGFPKKCAMPRGAGSVYDKLAAGMITWQSFLFWHLLKMLSDWTNGIVSLTYNQAREWLKFGQQTISNIKKELLSAGFFQRLSSAFQAFTCQLFPKPYPKRRKRRQENPKSMKLIDGFYYSFNEEWRVSRDSGQIQRSEPGSSRWRHANEFELENANLKIFNDFKPIIKLATSPHMQKLRSQHAAATA